MREFPLELIRRDGHQRAATAWLIPGADPLAWLTELARWPVDHELLRCVVLPRSDGLLVFLPEPFADLDRPHGCWPYGLVTRHLYAPVEAVIAPPLTDQEWLHVLPDPERITVWRATGDFIGFDPAEVLLVTEMLTASVNYDVKWNAAREAPVLSPRVRSIISTAPVPTVDDIAAQWDDEIGPRQPPQSAPPQPGEPSPTLTERLAASSAGLRRHWRQWRQTLSRQWARYGDSLATVFCVLLAITAVVVLQNLPPSTHWQLWTLLGFVLGGLLLAALMFGRGSPTDNSSSGYDRSRSPARGPSRFWTWVRNSWGAMQARGFSLTPFQDADQRQREREVKRLLRMLEENPEEGLRYAIPFGGDAGRGTGAAGNQLVARDLTFGLSGGGGTADFWDISVEQQLRLTQSYRLLAEREQRAGRHRRAAYIYSQLLNDWNSAANVLAAGHHHAEAAVIYEKRLQNIPEAAKQYELAGQTDTALKLHVDTFNWIAAAELCQRVDRPDEARQHYRHAVDAVLRTGNVPRAAELLEQKLGAVDEAFERLHEAWPNYACADACFDAWFDLAARHHRHEHALARLDDLTRRTVPDDALRLMPRLQRLQQRSPHAAVQHRARESSFELVARHLPEAPAPLAQSLTSFLPALVPNDRLLPRDCHRYVENCRSTALPQPSRPTETKPRLRCQRRFSLTDGPLSLPVFATETGWIALTERTPEKHQDLILTSWERVLRVNSLGRLPMQTTLVAVDPAMHVIWLSSSRAAVRLATPMDTMPWETISPSWLPGHTVRVLPGSARVLWFDDHGAAWLSEFQNTGTNVRSLRVAEEWLGDPQLAVRYMRGKAQLFERADGSTFTCLPVGDDQVFAEFFDRNQVRVWSSLLAGEEVLLTPRTDSLTAMILAQHQVILVDDFTRIDDTHRVHSGWNAARGVFLAGDLFVLVDDQHVALYRHDAPSPLIEHNHSASAAMAVTACGAAEFSVLRCNGVVEIWEY